jgi:hypothetical protein
MGSRALEDPQRPIPGVYASTVLVNAMNIITINDQCHTGSFSMIPATMYHCASSLPSFHGM